MGPGAWYVYVLRCNDGSLYTGITTDPQRRMQEHNHSSKGARYTRARRPVELVYVETVECRAAACKREYRIKQMTAGDKLALISAARFS